MPLKAIISEEAIVSSSGKGRLNSSRMGDKANTTQQNSEVQCLQLHQDCPIYPYSNFQVPHHVFIVTEICTVI